MFFELSLSLGFRVHVGRVFFELSLCLCQSFKRFAVELERLGSELQLFYERIRNVKEFCFHEWTVDWYGIAGQLPEVHRYFERPQDNMMLKRRRAGLGGTAPWVYGRT